MTLTDTAGGRGAASKTQIPFGDDDRISNGGDSRSPKLRLGGAGSAHGEREDKKLEQLASEMSAASDGASRQAAEMPLVAICGRPNVGKSTLFNRLTGTRRSIVGDEPGITRDRIYGEVEWAGRTVRLVDTGGVVPDDEALIPAEIFRQAQVALGEADAIIMVVDGRSELAAPDVELARLLLRNARVRPLFLAVNKMDSPGMEAAAENFRTLGFRNVVAVSAEHGSGIGDLPDEVSGARVAFMTAVSASSRAVGASVTRSRSPAAPGTHRSAPTSNRSFCTRASIASVSPEACRRRSPIAAFASSTVP